MVKAFDTATGTYYAHNLLETCYIFCTNHPDFTLVLQQLAKHLELVRKK
jgi:hypothetical protein